MWVRVRVNVNVNVRVRVRVSARNYPSVSATPSEPEDGALVRSNWRRMLGLG